MTTKIPNFAHGTFASIGVYLSLTAARVYGQSPYASLPLAFILTGLVGLALYGVILKPLMRRNASFVFLMTATLAFDLLMLGVLNVYADLLSSGFKVTSRYFALRFEDFRLVEEPGLFFVTPAVVLAAVVTIHIVLTRTKFGVAMRATVENPALSSVVGISVGRVYAVSWFIAGGLGGVSGSLLALWISGNPDVGSSILPSIFAASTVGGFLNIYGALLGGYLVGVAEILGTSYMSRLIGPFVIAYRPLIPLAIISITLLLAPSGLSAISRHSLRRLVMRLHGVSQ
jgi:branched-chain amino acid transport system permease protein